MYAWKSDVQGIQLIGSELRNSVLIKDATRAPMYLENKLEVSSGLFPMRFEDGEEILLHFSDLTEGRVDRAQRLLGVNARVYYRAQPIPVVITVGTSYARGAMRKDLRALADVWPEDCGCYEIAWERKVQSAQPNAAQTHKV